MVRVDKAIQAMTYDIITSNIFLQNPSIDLNNWSYYISIYANDKSALAYASRLLQSIQIRAKYIILMPETYKSCNFDCFSISDAFNNIHSSESYNINIISIIEQNDLDEGDFYISIIRQNESTKLMDIVTYKNLASYCES